MHLSTAINKCRLSISLSIPLSIPSLSLGGSPAFIHANVVVKLPYCLSGGSSGSGSGNGIAGGDGNTFVPPSTGLPLIVAVQTLPVEGVVATASSKSPGDVTSSRQTLGTSQMRRYKQIDVYERDVLELLYNENGQ